MKNILETQKNMICLLVLTTDIPSLLRRGGGGRTEIKYLIFLMNKTNNI